MSTEVINTDIKTKFLNLYKENSDIIKNGSPDFINQIRDKAIKLFEEIGIPDKKNENYKYTDLKKEFENGYKTYYIRAFIKTNYDIHYSNEKSIKTDYLLNIPINKRWNLISANVDGFEDSVQTVFKDIKDSILIITRVFRRLPDNAASTPFAELKLSCVSDFVAFFSPSTYTSRRLGDVTFSFALLN